MVSYPETSTDLVIYFGLIIDYCVFTGYRLVCVVPLVNLRELWHVSTLVKSSCLLELRMVTRLLLLKP